MKALHLKRWLAGFTVFAFTVTSLSFQPAFASSVPALDPALAALSFPSDIQKIELPKNLGRIESSFTGKQERLVLVVQDAHAIPEAQRSIEKIIEHFQETYGLSLIGLEGASSQLDPRIFTSFPDKQTLKKVFQAYYEKGELTGSVAAAIFGQKAAVFHGVEDWDLYEKGLTLYLDAVKDQPGLLEKLSIREKELNAKKQAFYAPELLEIDKALNGFYKNNADLPAILKLLAEHLKPAAGSEMALMVEELSRQETEENLEMEVRGLAGQFEKQLAVSVTGSQKDLEKEYQQKRQEFQTSHTSAQAFALWMKETAAREGFELKTSGRLAAQMGKHQKLRDIEGTKFFKNFEQYAESVKKQYLKTPEQAKLNKETKRLEILRKLIQLELSREEWEKLLAGIRSPQAGIEKILGVSKQDVQAQIDFYENASERDHAFFENLIKIAKKYGPETRDQRPRNQSGPRSVVPSLIVAGGFHAYGLTERLKAEGISYLLILPEISAIPEKTGYQEQMQGNVSWKDYFEVENGRVNLYKAFVRGTRDKLLGIQKDEKIEEAPAVSRRVLKYWRDEIIRSLADQKQIEKAGDYTRFLDELVSGKDSFSEDFDPAAKIDRFIDGLKNLKLTNRVTEQNIMNLAKTVTHPGIAASPDILTQGAWARAASVPAASRRKTVSPAATKTQTSRAESRVIDEFLAGKPVLRDKMAWYEQNEMTSVERRELDDQLVRQFAPQLFAVAQAAQEKNLRIRFFGGIARRLALASMGFPNVQPTADIDVMVPGEEILEQTGSKMEVWEAFWKEFTVRAESLMSEEETKTGSSIPRLPLESAGEYEVADTKTLPDWNISQFWIEVNPSGKGFVLSGEKSGFESIAQKKISLRRGVPQNRHFFGPRIQKFLEQGKAFIEAGLYLDPAEFEAVDKLLSDTLSYQDPDGFNFYQNFDMPTDYLERLQREKEIDSGIRAAIRELKEAVSAQAARAENRTPTPEQFDIAPGRHPFPVSLKFGARGFSLEERSRLEASGAITFGFGILPLAAKEAAKFRAMSARDSRNRAFYSSKADDLDHIPTMAFDGALRVGLHTLFLPYRNGNWTYENLLTAVSAAVGREVKLEEIKALELWPKKEGAIMQVNRAAVYLKGQETPVFLVVNVPKDIGPVLKQGQAIFSNRGIQRVPQDFWPVVPQQKASVPAVVWDSPVAMMLNEAIVSPSNQRMYSEYFILDDIHHLIPDKTMAPYLLSTMYPTLPSDAAQEVQPLLNREPALRDPNGIPLYVTIGEWLEGYMETHIAPVSNGFRVRVIRHWGVNDRDYEDVELSPGESQEFWGEIARVRASGSRFKDGFVRTPVLAINDGPFVATLKEENSKNVVGRDSQGRPDIKLVSASGRVIYPEEFLPLQLAMDAVMYSPDPANPAAGRPVAWENPRRAFQSFVQGYVDQMTSTSAQTKAEAIESALKILSKISQIRLTPEGYPLLPLEGGQSVPSAMHFAGVDAGGKNRILKTIANVPSFLDDFRRALSGPNKNFLLTQADSQDIRVKDEFVSRTSGERFVIDSITNKTGGTDEVSIRNLSASATFQMQLQYMGAFLSDVELVSRTAMRSEHRPLLTDFSVQEPLVDLSVDREKLLAWIEAQEDPGAQKLFRFLAPHLTYMDFPAFKEGLRKSVEGFQRNHQGDYAAVILGSLSEKPGPLSKSNPWVYRLARALGLRAPKSEIASIQQYLPGKASEWLSQDENLNVNDLVYVDDAAYSGRQVQEFVSLIGLALLENAQGKFKDRTITVHLVIPAITRTAKEKLLSIAEKVNRGQTKERIKFEFYDQSPMRTVGEIFDQEQADADIRNTFERLFPDQLDKPLTWIYKKPDFMSLPLAVGTGKTVLDGPVFNRDGKVDRYISFLPPVEDAAPYKAGYLEWIQKNIAGTEWASRIAPHALDSLQPLVNAGESRNENRDKSQLVHDQGMTLPETELRTLSQKYHISQSLLKKWAPFRVLPQMISEKAPWGSYLNRLHAMDSTLLFVWKKGEGGAYELEDEILSLVENDAALREFLWMTFENLKYGDKNSPNYVVWGITPDGRVLVQRVNQVDLERGESEDDFTYARRLEQLDRGWFQSEISGDPDPEGHGLSRVRRIFPRSFLIRKLNNASNPNKPWVVAEVTMVQRMPPNWKLRTFFFTAAAVFFTALGIFFWDSMSGPATPVNPDAGVEARVAVNFTALANYYTVFHPEQDLSPAGLLEWLDVYMDGPGIEAQLMGDNVRPALSVNPQHQMLQEDIRKKEGDNDYFRFVNGIRSALKEAKTQEAYEADPLLREFKKPKDILALIQSPAKTRQVYQDFLRRGIIKSTDGSKGSALLPERSENRDNLYTERGGAFLRSVSDISVAESIEEIKSLALRYRLRVMESPEAVKTKNDFYAGLTDGNKVEMVMMDTNGEKVSARWDVYPLKAETQYTISRLSPFYHIKEMLHIRSLAPENPWKKSSYPPGALRSLRYWAFYWPFIIDEEITKAIGFLFDAALYLFFEGTGLKRRAILNELRGQLKMLSNLESVKTRMLTSLSPAESAQTWEGTRIIQEGGALRVQSDPTFWEFQYSNLSTLESAFKEAFPQEGLSAYIERRAKEKASSGEVFTYVDWGAGNMNALAELAANLKQKGIQNVRLIGYSDQFFDEWGKLPENVEVIFDAYQNFPDYFRPGQKFEGVKADLIVSHIAMDHLRSKEDRRERDERPISIQDPYYLYLRDSIKPLLAADGSLLDIALTPVGEGVYAPFDSDFEVRLARPGSGEEGMMGMISAMMGIPKDSAKSPLVVFRPRAENRADRLLDVQFPEEDFQKVFRALDTESPTLQDVSGLQIHLQFPQSGIGVIMNSNGAVHVTKTGQDSRGQIRREDLSVPEWRLGLMTQEERARQRQYHETIGTRLLEYLSRVRFEYQPADDALPDPDIERDVQVSNVLLGSFLKKAQKIRLQLQSLNERQNEIRARYLPYAAQTRTEEEQRRLDALMTRQFTSLSTQEKDEMQILHAKGSGVQYQPFWEFPEDISRSAGEQMRSEGDFFQLKQGDVFYFQFLEVEENPEYMRQAAGKILKFPKTDREEVFLALEDGSTFNLYHVRRIEVNGKVYTLSETPGSTEALADVKAFLLQAEREGDLEFPAVVSEPAVEQFARVNGEMGTVLEAPAVQNTFNLTYQRTDGTIEKMGRNSAIRFIPIGKNEAAAARKSRLFQKGEKVVLYADNRFLTGTIFDFYLEPFFGRGIAVDLDVQDGVEEPRRVLVEFNHESRNAGQVSVNRIAASRAGEIIPAAIDLVNPRVMIEDDDEIQIYWDLMKASLERLLRILEGEHPEEAEDFDLGELEEGEGESYDLNELREKFRRWMTAQGILEEYDGLMDDLEKNLKFFKLGARMVSGVTSPPLIKEADFNDVLAGATPSELSDFTPLRILEEQIQPDMPLQEQIERAREIVRVFYYSMFNPLAWQPAVQTLDDMRGSLGNLRGLGTDAVAEAVRHYTRSLNNPEQIEMVRFLIEQAARFEARSEIQPGKNHYQAAALLAMLSLTQLAAMPSVVMAQPEPGDIPPANSVKVKPVPAAPVPQEEKPASESEDVYIKDGKVYRRMIFTITPAKIIPHVYYIHVADTLGVSLFGDGLEAVRDKVMRSKNGGISIGLPYGNEELTIYDSGDLEWEKDGKSEKITLAHAKARMEKLQTLMMNDNTGRVTVTTRDASGTLRGKIDNLKEDAKDIAEREALRLKLDALDAADEAFKGGDAAGEQALEKAKNPSSFSIWMNTAVTMLRNAGAAPYILIALAIGLAGGIVYWIYSLRKTISKQAAGDAPQKPGIKTDTGDSGSGTRAEFREWVYETRQIIADIGERVLPVLNVLLRPILSRLPSFLAAPLLNYLNFHMKRLELLKRFRIFDPERNLQKLNAPVNYAGQGFFYSLRMPPARKDAQGLLKRAELFITRYDRAKELGNTSQRDFLKWMETAFLPGPWLGDAEYQKNLAAYRKKGITKRETFAKEQGPLDKKLAAIAEALERRGLPRLSDWFQEFRLLSPDPSAGSNAQGLTEWSYAAKSLIERSGFSFDADGRLITKQRLGNLNLGELEKLLEQRREILARLDAQRVKNANGPPEILSWIHFYSFDLKFFSHTSFIVHLEAQLQIANSFLQMLEGSEAAGQPDLLRLYSQRELPLYDSAAYEGIQPPTNEYILGITPIQTSLKGKEKESLQSWVDTADYALNYQFRSAELNQYTEGFLADYNDLVSSPQGQSTLVELQQRRARVMIALDQRAAQRRYNFYSSELENIESWILYFRNIFGSNSDSFSGLRGMTLAYQVQQAESFLSVLDEKEKAGEKWDELFRSLVGTDKELPADQKISPLRAFNDLLKTMTPSYTPAEKIPFNAPAKAKLLPGPSVLRVADSRAENRSLIDQISDDARRGKSGSFDTVQAQIKAEAARILQGNDDGIFENEVEPSVRRWAGNNVKRYAIRLADILKSVKDSFDLPGQMESQIVSDEELAFAEKIRGLVTLEVLSRMAEKVMLEQKLDFQSDYKRVADVTAVRFFGSLIRNELTTASDIDYFVEVNDRTLADAVDFEGRFRETYQRYLRENGITSRDQAPYLVFSGSISPGIPITIEGEEVEEVRVPFPGRAENRPEGGVMDIVSVQETDPLPGKTIFTLTYPLRSEVRGDFLTSAFIRNSVTAAVMLSWSLGIPSELLAQKAPAQAAVKSETAADPKYEAAVRTVYGQMQAEGILPKASGVSAPGMKTALSQEDIEEIAKVMAEMTGRDLRRQGIKVERGTNLKNVDRYSKIGTSENALARSLIKFWLGPENLRDLIQKIKKPEQYYAETLFGDEKTFLEGYRQVIADAKKNNQPEEEQINAYLNEHAETLYTMATAMNGLDEDKLTAPFQRGDATYFVREWARKLNAFAEAQSVQKRLALLEDREGIAPSTLTLGGILDFLSLYKDFNRTVDGQAREAFRRVIAEISARPAADAQKKRMLSLPVSSAKARADELSEGILRSSAVNSILGDGELLQLVIEAYEANPQASREEFEALLKKNMDALAKLRTDRKLDAPKIPFDLLRFQIEVPRGDDGFTEFIETLRASNGEKDKIVKAFESARLESLDKGSLSYERDRIQSILFQMRTAPAVPGVDGEKSYLQLKQELDHMLLTTRSGITLALLNKYPDLVQNLPRFNTIAAAEFEAGEFRDEYVRLFGYAPVNGYEPGPRHLVDFLMKNPQTLETEKIFERVTQMLQLPGIDWSSAEMTDSLQIKLVRDKGFFSPKTRAYLPFPEGGDAQEKRARIADFIKTLHTTAEGMKKAAAEAKAAEEAKRKEKTKPKAPAAKPGGAKAAPGRSEMRSLLEEVNARELKGIVSQIAGYADWLGERGDPLGEQILGILRDPDLEPFISMAQDLEGRWENLPKKEGEDWEEVIQFLHGFDLNHENLSGNAGHYLAQRQARVEFMLRLLDGGRVSNPKNFLRRYLMSWAGVREPEMIEGFSPKRRYSQHGIFGMLPSLFRISSISFSPDGEKLVTVSQEGQIEIYNLRTGETDLLDYLQGSEPTEEGARNPYPDSVRFSPDGKYLILGASDNTLRMLDLTTGDERTFTDTPFFEAGPGVQFFTTPVRLTADGRVFSLHSGGDIRTIQIRDSQTMAVQRNLTLPDSSQFMYYTDPSFAVSPDGNFAAVTAAGRLVLYDLRGEFAETVQLGLSSVAYQPPLAFSDDGRYLLTIPSSMVPEAVRYDLSTIQNGELQPLSLFSSAYVNSFTAVAFLGSRVLTGDAHGNLHLWDPETDTHRVILPLKAQGSETYRINRISDIAIRPDGTVAVTYQNGVGIFSPDKIDDLAVPYTNEMMIKELRAPRSETRPSTGRSETREGQQSKTFRIVRGAMIAAALVLVPSSVYVTGVSYYAASSYEEAKQDNERDHSPVFKHKNLWMLRQMAIPRALNDLKTSSDPKVINAAARVLDDLEAREYFPELLEVVYRDPKLLEVVLVELQMWGMTGQPANEEMFLHLLRNIGKLPENFPLPQFTIQTPSQRVLAEMLTIVKSMNKQEQIRAAELLGAYKYYDGSSEHPEFVDLVAASLEQNLPQKAGDLFRDLDWYLTADKIPASLKQRAAEHYARILGDFTGNVRNSVFDRLFTDNKDLYHEWYLDDFIEAMKRNAANPAYSQELQTLSQSAADEIRAMRDRVKPNPAPERLKFEGILPVFEPLTPRSETRNQKPDEWIEQINQARTKIAGDILRGNFKGFAPEHTALFISALQAGNLMVSRRVMGAFDSIGDYATLYSQSAEFQQEMDKLYSVLNQTLNPEQKRLFHFSILMNYLYTGSITNSSQNANSEQAALITLNNFYPEIQTLLFKLLRSAQVDAEFWIARTAEEFDAIDVEQKEGARPNFDALTRNLTMLKDSSPLTPETIWPALLKLVGPKDIIADGDEIRLSEFSKSQLLLLEDLAVWEAIYINRSEFERTELEAYYNSLPERLAGLIEKEKQAIEQDSARIKRVLRFGIIGPAGGQEPLRTAIEIQKALQKAGVSSDAVDYEIHIFDRPSSFYRKLKENKLIYPERIIQNAPFQSAEKEANFALVQEGRLGGYKRSDALNERMFFYDADLLNPQMLQAQNVPGKFDELAIHNVVQYLQPELLKDPKQFPETVQATGTFLRELMNPGAAFSVYYPHVEKAVFDMLQDVSAEHPMVYSLDPGKVRKEARLIEARSEERAPKDQEERAPRPLVDLSVDPQKLELWINSQQTVAAKNLMRFLAPHLRYVNQTEFEATLKKSIEAFQAEFQGDYVAVTSPGSWEDHPDKSNTWVYRIARELGLRDPKVEVGTVREAVFGLRSSFLNVKAGQIIDGQTIKDLVYVDDAAYSGTQILQWLEFLDQELAEGYRGSRKITVHFIIPFMTSTAKNKFLEAAAASISRIQLKFYDQGGMKTVGEVLDEGKAKPEIRKSFEKLFPRELDKAITWLHRKPDFWSVPHPGGDDRANTILDGPVLDKKGNVVGLVPFMPPVEAGFVPYGKDYLQKIQKEIGQGEWASRILPSTPARNEMRQFVVEGRWNSENPDDFLNLVRLNQVSFDLRENGLFMVSVTDPAVEVPMTSASGSGNFSKIYILPGQRGSVKLAESSNFPRKRHLEIEIQTLRQLNASLPELTSRNAIPELVAAGQIAEHHYEVLGSPEDAEDLMRLQAAEPEMGFARRLEILTETARILESVNRAGVLHNDLKPMNLLVGNRGQGSVQLIDFGNGVFFSAATAAETKEDLIRYIPMALRLLGEAPDNAIEIEELEKIRKAQNWSDVSTLLETWRTRSETRPGAPGQRTVSGTGRSETRKADDVQTAAIAESVITGKPLTLEQAGFTKSQVLSVNADAFFSALGESAKKAAAEKRTENLGVTQAQIDAAIDAIIAVLKERFARSGQKTLAVVIDLENEKVNLERVLSNPELQGLLSLVLVTKRTGELNVTGVNRQTINGLPKTAVFSADNGDAIPALTDTDTASAVSFGVGAVNKRPGQEALDVVGLLLEIASGLLVSDMEEVQTAADVKNPQKHDLLKAELIRQLFGSELQKQGDLKGAIRFTEQGISFDYSALKIMIQYLAEQAVSKAA